MLDNCVKDVQNPSKDGLVNNQPSVINQNGIRTLSSIPEISNFRKAFPQFLAVSVKNTLLFVYGMTLGFPTIVIPAIQGGDGREPSDIVLSKEQISWFSSINLICVPLGCIFSGIFSNPIGKRRAMQVVSIPLLASWLVFHFATSIEHLYLALCLSGLTGGLMEAPVLTYVSEVTDPKYRGILQATGSTCVILGVFIEFVLGSFLDWRTIASVNTVFPVLSMLALFFIPESPYWLIKKKKYDEAINALAWLRGWVPKEQVQIEFNELYELLIVKPSKDNNSKLSKCYKTAIIFKSRVFLIPFVIVLFCFFTGHFSGKTTLQTYAVQIFHTLKAPINKYHATILLGFAELIGTVLCTCLIHFIGKRPLVFISLTGCGICYFGAATYAYFLNIVPGFAIGNVVANASFLVPQENFITINNLTNIFDNEEKALENLQNISIATEKYIEMNLLNDTFETETLSPFNMNNNLELNFNRTKRDLNYDDYNSTELFFDDTTIIYDLNTTEKLKESNIVAKTTSKPFVDKESEITKEILLPVPKQETNNYLWVPLVLLLLSALFAHLGIRLIPWMLISEVFPTSIRSTASGICGACGYIFGFLANKTFLQMLATMTMPGTFWFYSAVSIFGIIVLYFVLPETEGKSLGEIEQYFSDNKSNGNNIQPEISTSTIDITSIPLDTQNSMALGVKRKKINDNHLGSINAGFNLDENVRNNVTRL